MKTITHWQSGIPEYVQSAGLPGKVYRAYNLLGILPFTTHKRQHCQ
jgi:hypothetical protein